tara:strand:+ start:76 stop:891 length:816 start_codon:yes stop_codon:yes gene_type:complete
MILKNLAIFCLIILTCFSFKVLAKQENKEVSSELTVEADISLEWFEKEKYYLAKGNVILKKDGLTLKANIVKATYEIENGENVIKNITAKETVILTKDKAKATGKFMSYDVNKKIAIISGPFQTFSSPSGYIESNKILMFDDLRNKAEAKGNVKIILSNKSTIYADDVKADFTSKDKSLEKAIAKGNVVIENVNKGRKSKADLGIYNSSDEIIKLSGNVTIINQNSIIKGSKGITNLKTGISNIIGDPKKEKRVKGIFSPTKKINNRDKID